jgi:hypothetical protein
MHKFACYLSTYLYHMTWHNLIMVSKLVTNDENKKKWRNFPVPHHPSRHMSGWVHDIGDRLDMYECYCVWYVENRCPIMYISLKRDVNLEYYAPNEKVEHSRPNVMVHSILIG